MLALQVYSIGIHIASVFNPKAKAWVEGRNRSNYPMPSKEKRIWFHAASLGEYEQARPVIDELKQQYPNKKFVITFFSPSGFEVAKRKHSDDEVLYLPLDTAQNACFITDYINPEIAIFVKYEYWYFTIQELYNRNVPVLLVAAFFRPEQIFFRTYGSFFRNMLHYYHHIFVQDKNSMLLLEKHGIGQVTVCGDTRFDRVMKIASGDFESEIIDAFRQQSKIFIAGSTWNKDEAMLAQLINSVYKNHPDIKFIIAPHEIHLPEIEKLQQSILAASARYSSLSIQDAAHYHVLIIDNIGMLSKLFRYAQMAYVGGGFNKGIHNILEPAVYGIPVLFGPRCKRFKEAEDMLEMKVAFSVRNADELEMLFEKFQDNEVLMQHCKKELEIYFQENEGAAREISAYIQKLLKNIR